MVARKNKLYSAGTKREKKAKKWTSCDEKTSSAHLARAGLRGNPKAPVSSPHRD